MHLVTKARPIVITKLLCLELVMQMSDVNALRATGTHTQTHRYTHRHTHNTDTDTHRHRHTDTKHILAPWLPHVWFLKTIILTNNYN